MIGLTRNEHKKLPAHDMCEDWGEPFADKTRAMLIFRQHRQMDEGLVSALYVGSWKAPKTSNTENDQAFLIVGNSRSCTRELTLYCTVLLEYRMIAGFRATLTLLGVQTTMADKETLRNLRRGSLVIIILPRLQISTALVLQ